MRPAVRVGDRILVELAVLLCDPDSDVIVARMPEQEEPSQFDLDRRLVMRPDDKASVEVRKAANS